MADDRSPDIEIVDDDNGRNLAEDSQIILAADVMPTELPIIPSSSKPVFPGMVFPVVLGDGPSANLISRIANDKQQDKVLGFVLTREEIRDDQPAAIVQQLYNIGTVARLVNFQEAPDGSVRALLQGIQRFEILQVRVVDDHIVARVYYLKEEKAAPGENLKAISLAIMNTMRELMKNNPIFSEEIKMFLGRASWDDPGRLADFAVSVTAAESEELQDILECLNVEERLQKALFLLRKELDINRLKERITHQIEEKISTQQREFFLREQLKAIKTELGLEKDEKESELDEFRDRIADKELPPAAEKKIEEELKKLQLLASQSPEFAVTRNYLDWLTAMPWGVTTEDHLDVAAARQVLDRDHTGLEDVKERILEFIGVSKLRGGVEGSILCLIGPPGVGKTSLGRSIADALGREFFRFSLGGMRDEAEIKGHRRTYIGAMPGKIVQTIRNTGTQNPVIMLDEIDKVGMSFQGDPASALLEVLDPEQNHAFLDHYLDVPFDLSKVLFIATANVPDTIPGPLLDRMETIRLSGYVMEEKLAIARNHLVPRLLPDHGLGKKDVRFTDPGIRALIDGYAREAGVRALEKAIRGVLRKIAAKRAEGEDTGRVTVTAKVVEELLGQPRFRDDAMFKQHQPGVATGLAWTALGGTVLFIEAMAIPGKPGFTQTGQLGDVMKESASIAYSYVHSNARKLGIADQYFEEHSVHLHVPAGATPKDGPSAGITMASALAGMANGTPLPKRLAMTGELTLTGKVLPVGGIKEKMIAAVRSGIRDVILPDANRKDFDEIPDHQRGAIVPHYVADYKQVAKLVFHGGLENLRKQRES